MKNIFFSLFLSFCLFSRGFSLNITKMYGHWIQVYSNNYVQLTSENDWFCVNLDVTPSHKNNSIFIQKNTFIHNTVPLSTTLSLYNNFTFDKDDHKYTFHSSLENTFKLLYTENLSDETYEYLIWTLDDNLSLYVWARDFDDFQLKYRKTVLNILKQNNYNGYYKTPSPSYSIECEENE